MVCCCLCLLISATLPTVRWPASQVRKLSLVECSTVLQATYGLLVSTLVLCTVCGTSPCLSSIPTGASGALCSVPWQDSCFTPIRVLWPITIVRYTCSSFWVRMVASSTTTSSSVPPTSLCLRATCWHVPSTSTMPTTARVRRSVPPSSRSSSSVGSRTQARTSVRSSSRAVVL